MRSNSLFRVSLPLQRSPEEAGADSSAVEAVVVANKIFRLLPGLSVSFPFGKSKVFPLDHPEIVPITLLMVGTKLCFSFDTSISAPAGTLMRVPTLNWSAWQEDMADVAQYHEELRLQSRFTTVHGEQVASMDEGELCAYFSQVAGLTEHRGECLYDLHKTTAHRLRGFVGRVLPDRTYASSTDCHRRSRS